MHFLRRATKRCARRGTSSDAQYARTGARFRRPHAPGRPSPFSLPAAPTGPCCAVPSPMPDRNNTNPPRSNSFRRFCTAETCRYLYCWRRHAAARQSSRHLAYMQGARIKACGSFPPTNRARFNPTGKSSGEYPVLRRFAGTPKQNHPKISCPEQPRDPVFILRIYAKNACLSFHFNK